MTYDDFYINSSIMSIQSLRNLTSSDFELDYLLIYNGTATKLILVKQPQTCYKIKRTDDRISSGLLRRESLQLTQQASAPLRGSLGVMQERQHRI